MNKKILTNNSLIDSSIVKTLYKRDDQQETLLSSNGSSETKHDNINYNIYLDKIPEHIPNHKKPSNDNELGSYLAGLIDGDGHFDKQNKIVIAYSIEDYSVAYWLKSQLNSGSVSQVKGKESPLRGGLLAESVVYVISDSTTVVRVLELINGKLRLKYKYDQVLNNMLSKESPPRGDS